jgi:metal-responsive CopG/Arc/MetJ family transcriptional regulator
MSDDPTTHVAFRCPDELLAKINDAAKKEDRTRSGQILHMLRKQLKERK